MVAPGQPPLVLAGPVVRQTTPSRVHVWLATSRLLDPPHLTLFAAAGPGAPPLRSEPEWYPVILGRRLVVYLLVAKLDEALVPGRVYEYDIRLNGVSSLFGPDELQQIVLRGRSRPSFLVGKTAGGAMRALYGSCRKLHGPRPDMMIAAEKILQESGTHERPEYLLLGGDQVYADDVHPSVLALSDPVQRVLIGRPEVVPGLPARAYSRVESRAPYLKAYFTSTHMDHHLLTFAEYVTAYLLAWSPDAWRYLIDVVAATIPIALPAGIITGVRSARRVLANIVTYMVFDDHEVTDDWFRTEKWTERALGHRAAERIITNGMVAYWAFQGWGNTPDAFDERFRSMMGAYAESAGRNQDEVWRALAATRWSYVTPTSPPVLVLDTRTRRETSRPHQDAVDYGFPGGAIHPFSPGVLAQGIHSAPEVLYRRRNVEAPRLLNAQERDRVRQLLADHAESQAPLVVIAPSPIFGFPPLEWLQDESGKVVPDVADLESWAGNPRNLLDAVELLLSPGSRPLVILSGDVHYGFELVGRVHRKDGSVPFVQLCSSAFKNRPMDMDKTSLQILSRFGNEDRTTVYWDLRTGGATDGPLAWMEITRPSIQTFEELFGEPAMILETRFVRRAGRIDGHQRLEIENNLGDLVIEKDRVFHRHWVGPEGGGLVAREWSDWKTWDWPVPDPLTALVEAIVGDGS